MRVRIVSKEGREIVGIEHIGVAHNEGELKMFMSLARERLFDKKQQELKFSEFDGAKAAGIVHKKSYSKYLYETIGSIYNKIGINEVSDEVFKQITIARIILPASKLDTIEILDDLGLEAPTNTGIHIKKPDLKQG
jgi:hypothetical protein